MTACPTPSNRRPLGPEAQPPRRAARRFAVACCLSGLAALACTAHAAGPGHAHQHGIAKLDVAIDPRSVSLSLEMPLDSLVGFERAPRSPAERQKVDAALARLKEADALFRLDPAAGCSLQQAAFSAPVLGVGKPATPAAPATQGDDGHGDLDADYVFACQDSARLGAIEVGLFKAFASLQKIDVQVATPKGQLKRQLTRQDPRLTLSGK